MVKQIIGTIDATFVTDYHGNEREYVDLYDEPTNQVLFDLTSEFHGKKVKITIQLIEEDSKSA
jgi:hypothetical protein